MIDDIRTIIFVVIILIVGYMLGGLVQSYITANETFVSCKTENDLDKATEYYWSCLKYNSANSCMYKSVNKHCRGDE